MIYLDRRAIGLYVMRVSLRGRGECLPPLLLLLLFYSLDAVFRFGLV